MTVYGIANGQRSPMSSGVSYTYDSGHQYVKYRLDGEWRLCIPYVFMSGGWAECIPYYYDENGQHECSG